jgi:hypothetical protein
MPIKFVSIVMDLINALPGKSSVNTNTGNNITELCFLCDPRRAKARSYRKSVARQRNGKQASITMGDGVFLRPCKVVILKTNGATSQF